MDSFTYTSGERLTAARKRRIAYVCGVIVCGVLVGTFLFWLINGRSFSGKKGGITPDSCSAVPDAEKFDCHPDRPISEKECLNRGCCYKAASDLGVTDFDLKQSSYIGVPSCYFSSDYKGYSFKLLKNDDSSIKGLLTRKNISSGFTDTVQKVSLDISYIDDNSLRIKLTDAVSKRYVPDTPLYVNPSPRKNPLYDVKLDNDGLLTITRKSSSAVVFKTKLSQLIYSDQFLQLSTFVASQNFYGFGEHKDRIRRSFDWTRITQFNQGDLPVPHRNLYGTHPFYLIVEPDGNANGVFLRNTNAMDAILQPAPAVTLRTIGGILDFFVMLGPKPDNVISQYTGLIGRPFMIPYWSLGFQLCRYGYFSLNKTNETLQRNLEAGVPVDVQWHDIDYMRKHLDFTYDDYWFNGLDDWVKDLHRQGIKYIAMISPGVSNTEENGTYPAYDKGKELDLFVKDVYGNDIESKVWNDNYTVYPDFTNPNTQKYWKDRFVEFHSILDFDGVWLDMNEPLNFDNGTYDGCPESPLEDPQYVPGRPYPLRTLTICMTAKHYSTDHYNEHNLVAYRESRDTYLAMKDIRNKRPFLLSRATHAGQGVYTSHWSGDITSDWDDLRYTIPFMMVFNMYGMPMVGSDICGFRLNTTEELCARWQALGAFYPFSRNHNDFDTIEQDPAFLGGDVLEATKNALGTRYYLLPYFYYLFYRSHVFGETAVRPLFFEFPSDQTALSIDEAFLWGPALYVIPALYPGIKEVEAYFPKAVWYDFYDGKRITDKAENKTLSANITHINLAVRGGYILPLQLPAQTVADSRENEFDILVALDDKQEASGEFYWDDGDSLDTYKNGVYNLNKFTAAKNTFNNTIIKHQFHSLLNLNVIRVFGVNQRPTKVTINGQDAPKFEYNETTLTITAKGSSLKEQLVVKWN
ncbi:lysosomal alpha-glucosidase [Parasteatoda tepidariorum]|uniref:lysosomal alpha-glucosidase n=1 Tax=Parasteatoda tepidariorum TaxID=114398 RepID=UPI001C7211E2|nr:lysosomal alpha-glucosidase [Parasteatoda tepidariorum]